VVSPADADRSRFVVVEMRGCSQIRFGGPSDEAMSGHPLYGKGLDGYRAHEVVNSRWIEEAIKITSVHPTTPMPVPAAAPLRAAIPWRDAGGACPRYRVAW
jgi:hypothetical protein